MVNLVCYAFELPVFHSPPSSPTLTNRDEELKELIEAGAWKQLRESAINRVKEGGVNDLL